MKTKPLSILVLLLISFLVFIGCSAEKKDISSEISKINQTINELYEKGEINSILENYTLDAKLLPVNVEEISGHEQILKFYENVAAMGIKKLVFETKIAEQYGDIAIEEGLYSLSVEGGMVVDQGKYLVTWQNENGIWKVKRDIWTTNLAAAPVRANINESIWLIKNHIKADKTDQFEEFSKTILKPAGDELFPESAKTVRLLKLNSINKSGSFTYFYMMDPYNQKAGEETYDINNILIKKYGEEKAMEYMKSLNEYYSKEATEVMTLVPLY